MLSVFAPVLAAAVLGGGGCALSGYFLSNLRLPFLGVCLSHAAMAGAVFANLFGLPIWPVAFVASVTAAFAVGYVADRMRLEPNVSMGIIFSMTLGLAFIGIGLTPGPKTGALGLIWGSLLLVTPAHVVAIAVASLLAGLFALAFAKELKAVLFSRAIAASSGVREGLVYYVMLVICGLVVTVNLEAVGGLMLFSLLVAPAAAAAKLTRRYWTALGLSVAFGAVSALGGFAVSYALDTPTGATIVVVASLLFLGCSALGARLERRGTLAAVAASVPHES